jgi:HD superfamily phosphohydrolase
METIKETTENLTGLNEELTFEKLLVRRIYDDVHGFVALTDLEKELLNNSYMRRLHFIKQNAIANFVFPGATHTRFSHSIGVLHLTEKMVQKLKTLSKKKIDITPIDHQVIRLAALLHDVGHYPLSHTIEQCYIECEEIFFTPIQRMNFDTGAVSQIPQDQEYCKIFNKVKSQEFIDKISKSENINDILNEFETSGGSTSVFNHERIASKIIKHSKSLNTLIKKILNDICKQFNIVKTPVQIDGYISLIGQLIYGKPHDIHNPVLADNQEERIKYNLLSLLIHSNLDADQMDYMLRDTTNTGIQTTIRVDFLIDNLDICYRKDAGGKLIRTLAFDYKAFETIQQFLLSKFYWYTEILLYEKVAILNEIAKFLSLYMLLTDIPEIKNPYISYDNFKNDFITNEEEFFFFNDDFFWSKIKQILISKKVPKRIKQLAKILYKGEIPAPMSFSELSKFDIKIKKTEIVHEALEFAKNENGKIRILKKLKSKKHQRYMLPRTFERRFFQPNIEKDYKNRTIYIMKEPCKYCNKNQKKCDNIINIADSDLFGSNLIHKLFGMTNDNNVFSSYIRKYCIYNFEKQLKN